MKQPDRVGMRDVARIAGVSLSTVSRILNDKAGSVSISEATRKQVLAVVDRLDYRPNFAAQRLRSAEPDQSVGLYIPWGWTSRGLPEFVPIMTESIGRYLHDKGCGLAVVYYQAGAISEHYEELHRVRNHPTQGMIIAGASAADMAFLDSVAQNRHPPCVAVHRELRSGNYVTADNRGGARTAVEWLIGKGHQRIAFISRAAEPEGSADYVYDERRSGYREALAGKALPLDPALERQVDPHDEQSTAAAIESLWRLAPRPTAIFATRLEIAAYCLRALRRRGSRVPGDVSLVSFAEHPTLGEYLDPAVTTVDLPSAEMGENAAAAILQLIQRNRRARDTLHMTAACSMTIRESA